MKVFSILLIVTFFSLGCAKVNVGGTSEAIKLDISMRLDIYQHVVKDIDAIENIVSGSKDKKKVLDKQSFLRIFVSEAYAGEGLSPEVEQAAFRRKDRLLQLSSWEEKGIIGEDKSGLVEIRNSQSSDSSLNQIVSLENSDRMIIYQFVANKNGTSVEEVQKLYAKRLQQDAPLGTPIEIVNQKTGSAEWKIK